MRIRIPSLAARLWPILLPVCLRVSAEEAPLRVLKAGSDPSRAILRVLAGERAGQRIPKFITGKFCEHLGWNIYNGMDSQILRNPTFADYPFWTGQMTPDGVTRFHSDEERIVQELRRQATRFGWPESELENLARARADGLACFWTRVGPREAVEVSPDTGPFGGRAQRVRVQAAGQGIAQWVYFPLHRTKRYEFELLGRSPGSVSLRLSLSPSGSEGGAASAPVISLSRGWKRITGVLEAPADVPQQAACKLAVTAEAPGEFVVRHVLLRPADHRNGFDPDVVRLLGESRLPILRWPGGNFVSSYHWAEGVGRIERRPTLPNYAWGAIEPNLFGTDEFIAFCRTIGCEPMICINGGSGTPEEAARWIEYCNGSTTTPMGALRAANGHPEPYNVRHWEVGNELWGRWQSCWTTASGYADRFVEFSKAMLAADSNITLYACGAPVFWGKHWNDVMISSCSSILRTTTDHPLIGGDVSPATELTKGM